MAKIIDCTGRTAIPTRATRVGAYLKSRNIRAAFFLINKEAQKYAATAAQSDETCLSRQAAPSLRSSHIPDPADRARETVPLARCGAS